jgi:hypothetical protein
MRLQAEVEAKRATWAEGAWPHAYRNIEVRLYARAFVYALDTINQILGRLAAESQVPVEVGVAHEEFRNAVPNLRPLRNSLHHAEDRGLGENRNRKPIVAKPITAGPIRTAGGELVIMESLAGDTFSGTADDGSHSSVDVTASTLEASQKAIQRVLGAFAWVDDPEHLPS